MHQFKLSDNFIEQYRNKQPDWGFGTLSYITYKRTYSRDKDNGSTEEFWETVKRVVEGVYNTQKEHCEKLNLIWDNRRAQRSAQKMFEKMWNFKFLPPGRGLWAMGSDAVSKKGGACLNNCAFVSTEEISHDPSAPFCWAMDMLMLGVGVGFDTKGANKLEICGPDSVESTPFVIPDTREGWIEAVKMVIESYTVGGITTPIFDYSNIRPIGVPIKTFGGKSSGPGPLKDLLNSLEDLFISRSGKKLTSVDIVDIMNFIGKAVVSGNVRRSAEVAIGDIDDRLFVECKDPSKFGFELGDRRWASNNSVMAKLGMDYSYHASVSAVNGEPGYIFEGNIRKYGRLKDEPDFIDSDFKGLNPCLEQVLENYELCCLVETFPANHDSVEEYWETLKYAYLYAKTVTLIPTHDPRTNAVVLRNRRIGTSMSGVEQAKNKFGAFKFYNEFCDAGYNVLKNWDKVYSNWLCIPRSKRITSVKPSGTVSLLAGATPGVHAAHAEYYYRTVRFSHNSPLIPLLYNAGYRIEYNVNDVKWRNSEYKLNSSYTGDLVVYFPIHEKNFTKGKFDQTIWEQMENIAKMQYYWADNSVSVTINFKPEEASSIKDVLEIYQDRLKAVSFLALKDHGYLQAPYITIDKKEYENSIKNLKSIKHIDLIADDKSQDIYCEGDKCQIK